MYYDGPRARVLNRTYSNRRGSMADFVGQAGILTNNTTLITSAKMYFKEVILFGIYPTGYYVDFLRGVGGDPEDGFGYAILEEMLSFADALARTGDTFLYMFSTDKGTTNTANTLYPYSNVALDASSGGSTQKNIPMYIMAMNKLRNHEASIYGTDISANLTDAYKMDGVDVAQSFETVTDI